MATIIGIDCATEDKNVGLAHGRLVDGRVEVSEALSNFRAGKVLQALSRWIDLNSPTLIAIDAPLGWPKAMGHALAAHQAGRSIAVEANRLFRRRTDICIKERLSKQSLDVGADRIARTALRALGLISELETALAQPIELAWKPSLHGVGAIEVYPAATLISYRIPARCYKDEGGAEARAEIVGRLGDHVMFSKGEVPSACIADADVLDAAVCVLAGADFLRGRAVGPCKEDAEVARKEGWIWCQALLPPAPGLAEDT